MTKSIFIFFASICMMLCSCSDSNFSMTDLNQAQSRSSSAIPMEITLMNRSDISVNASSFSAQYLGTDSISLVVNPGQLNAASYTARSFTASQSDDAMDIIKNPGAYQTNYTEKNLIIVTTNGSGQLVLEIHDGNISTTAHSLIGEETEGM